MIQACQRSAGVLESTYAGLKEPSCLATVLSTSLHNFYTNAHHLHSADEYDRAVVELAVP
jgi:hypothetical protein